MESTQYIKSVIDDPGYFGKFLVGWYDHYRSIFFVYPISQPTIEILTQSFQDRILGVYPLLRNVMDDPGYSGKFWLGEHDHYRSIFFVKPISRPIIEISTKKVPHMILQVYPVNRIKNG